MDTSNELATELWKLSHTILDNAMMSGAEIPKVNRVYFTPKVEMFEYEEGINRYSVSEQFSEREDPLVGRDKLVETKIRPLPQYKEIAGMISKMYDVSLQQADYWLSRFCYRLLSVPLSAMTDEVLVEYVAYFIGDLEGIPKEWSPTVWLSGIWLKTDKLALREGLEIRRPTPADIEHALECSVEMIWSRRIIEESPSAILELRFRAKHQPEVHEEIERILNVLRLYRVGSIAAVRTEWHSKSILELDGVSFRASAFAPIYRYGIGSENLEDLGRFFEVIKPLIPVKVSQGSAENLDYTVIALQRYNDSLLKPDTVEARLTSVTMCLEALYLKTDEREELSRRLAQRAAKALSYLGHNPLEVYETVRRAYNTRSKYVHGSQIGKEESRGLNRVMDMVLEYARLSLVLLLQLKGSVEKEGFLSMVDNSLLSEEASDRLQKLVSPHTRSGSTPSPTS